MRRDGKVLLIHFRGCSHTRVVSRYDVASVIRGTQAECLECAKVAWPPRTVMRTIAEQSWVDAKRIGET